MLIMRNDETHLSDAELVQFIDGELDASTASRVEEHQVACWQCRARRAELERAISDYVQIHQKVVRKIPPMEESRTHLVARLVELASAEATRKPGPAARLGRLAYGGAALCLIAAIGLVMYFSVERARAASIPDEQLTPGVTRDVSKEDICMAGASDGFYPIPANTAFSVFRQYRIQNPQPRSYEVDYLITPALGGADDIRNLWPQPYATGEWNAHVKDALEHHLHELV